MFCCIHQCLRDRHTHSPTHKDAPCISSSFQFVILKMHPNIRFLSLKLLFLPVPSFLSLLRYSSTSSPPSSLFHPSLFFFRRQAPGVISKVSVGDSVLSLKSLRNHTCSLLSSIVCSFLSVPLSLSPSLLPHLLAHCCLSEENMGD